MADAVLRVIWLARARWQRTDDQGASLVEYALLLALIAMVCLVAVMYLGSSTQSFYTGAGSSLASN